MEFPIKIDFTTKEWEIIADRLGLPDCLSDALAEDDEAKRDAIYHTSAEMLEHGPEMLINNTLEWDILEDCIEGSTIPPRVQDARMYGSPKDRDWGRAMNRATLNIERKVLDASGIQVLFPKW